MNDDIFNEAQEIRGYELLSIKAMAQYAESKTNKRGGMDKRVRKAIREAWDCDPLPYARAARMFPDWFKPDYDVSKYELLSAIKIGSVADVFVRQKLVEKWQARTWSYDQVRKLVDRITKPKARATKVKTCPHCGEEI